MSEILQNCPVCQSMDLQPWMEVKDHFLSGDLFILNKCLSCGFIFVNPRPAEDEISAYYQSKEYISHDAEKKDLFTLLYKVARYFSIQGKYRIIHDYAKGKRLLDFEIGRAHV